MVHPIALTLQPGTDQTASEYEAQGRYVDMDKVRFFQGRAEKIGGWEAWNIPGQEVTAVCRSILLWLDFNYNYWHAFGTSSRLWVYDQDKTRTNITPFVSTGSLANPFTTTLDSFDVTVNDVAHGLVVGQYVNFSGATVVGGITIDGEYQVITVVDSDNYVITHSVAATSTASGGGAAVAYSYELQAGFVDVYRGGGWGLGTWGTGTWGTVRSSNTYLQFPRFWSLDKYGQYLLALPSGGTLYEWTLSTSSRAAAVANAPATGLFMFVTTERMVVILGADGDFMKMAWCDDTDITLWAAADTNTANTRKLQAGSRLVAGCALAQAINLVWTDTSVYLMQFTGTNFVYSTRVVGTNCGLVGPGAFVAVAGIGYWMSEFSFHMYNGSVSEIPNSNMVSHLFASLTVDQRIKVGCFYNPKFNEVWWIYPSTPNTEPDRYVAVSLDDFGWIIGTMDRSAWGSTSVNGTSEIFAVDASGTIFMHETGVDDDGAAMDWQIETGYMDLQDGNVGIDIDRYIPDFKRQTGAIDLEFTSKDYPADTAVLQTESTTIPEATGLVDLRHFGRQVKFKLSQTGVVGGDFRLGKQRIVLGETGTRE